jgi:hypothetical protein
MLQADGSIQANMMERGIRFQSGDDPRKLDRGGGPSVPFPAPRKSMLCIPTGQAQAFPLPGFPLQAGCPLVGVMAHCQERPSWLQLQLWWGHCSFFRL